MRGANEKLEAGEYADAKARFAALGGYRNSADMVRECDYRPAKVIYDAGDYAGALAAFEAAALTGYSDSSTIMNDCRYQLGMTAMATADYETAKQYFAAAGDYQDAPAQLAGCEHQLSLAGAREAEAAGRYMEAYDLYSQAG